MKPETKRFLAKEWLIFWSISVTLWLLIHSTTNEYRNAYDEFWSQTETGRRVCDDPKRLAIAVPPHLRETYIKWVPVLDSEHAKYELKVENSEAYRKEAKPIWDSYVQTLPLIVRTQATLYSVVVGVLEGLTKLKAKTFIFFLAVYLFLWIPRLTVRAVQMLWRRPDVAK
jgi:hypothetical protein